eukprot:Rmarinus@m.22532
MNRRSPSPHKHMHSPNKRKRTENESSLFIRYVKRVSMGSFAVRRAILFLYEHGLLEVRCEDNWLRVVVPEAEDAIDAVSSSLHNTLAGSTEPASHSESSATRIETDRGATNGKGNVAVPDRERDRGRERNVSDLTAQKQQDLPMFVSLARRAAQLGCGIKTGPGLEGDGLLLHHAWVILEDMAKDTTRRVALADTRVIALIARALQSKNTQVAEFASIVVFHLCAEPLGKRRLLEHDAVRGLGSILGGSDFKAAVEAAKAAKELIDTSPALAALAQCEDMPCLFLLTENHDPGLRRNSASLIVRLTNDPGTAPALTSHVRSLAEMLSSTDPMVVRCGARGLYFVFMSQGEKIVRLRPEQFTAVLPMIVLTLEHIRDVNVRRPLLSVLVHCSRFGRATDISEAVSVRTVLALLPQINTTIGDAYTEPMSRDPALSPKRGGRSSRSPGRTSRSTSRTGRPRDSTPSSRSHSRTSSRTPSRTQATSRGATSRQSHTSRPNPRLPPSQAPPKRGRGPTPQRRARSATPTGRTQSSVRCFASPHRTSLTSLHRGNASVSPSVKPSASGRTSPSRPLSREASREPNRPSSRELRHSTARERVDQRLGGTGGTGKDSGSRPRNKRVSGVSQGAVKRTPAAGVGAGGRAGAPKADPANGTEPLVADLLCTLLEHGKLRLLSTPDLQRIILLLSCGSVMPNVQMHIIHSLLQTSYHVPKMVHGGVVPLIVWAAATGDDALLKLATSSLLAIVKVGVGRDAVLKIASDRQLGMRGRDGFGTVGVVVFRRLLSSRNQELLDKTLQVMAYAACTDTDGNDPVATRFLKGGWGWVLDEALNLIDGPRPLSQESKVAVSCIISHTRSGLTTAAFDQIMQRLHSFDDCVRMISRHPEYCLSTKHAAKAKDSHETARKTRLQKRFEKNKVKEVEVRVAVQRRAKAGLERVLDRREEKIQAQLTRASMNDLQGTFSNVTVGGWFGKKRTAFDYNGFDPDPNSPYSSPRSAARSPKTPISPSSPPLSRRLHMHSPAPRQAPFLTRSSQRAEGQLKDHLAGRGDVAGATGEIDEEIVDIFEAAAARGAKETSKNDSVDESPLLTAGRGSCSPPSSCPPGRTSPPLAPGAPEASCLAPSHPPHLTHPTARSQTSLGLQRRRTPSESPTRSMSRQSSRRSVVLDPARLSPTPTTHACPNKRPITLPQLRSHPLAAKIPRRKIRLGTPEVIRDICGLSSPPRPRHRKPNWASSSLRSHAEGRLASKPSPDAVARTSGRKSVSPPAMRSGPPHLIECDVVAPVTAAVQPALPAAESPKAGRRFEGDAWMTDPPPPPPSSFDPTPPTPSSFDEDPPARGQSKKSVRIAGHSGNGGEHASVSGKGSAAPKKKSLARAGKRSDAEHRRQLSAILNDV